MNFGDVFNDIRRIVFTAEHFNAGIVQIIQSRIRNQFLESVGHILEDKVGLFALENFAQLFLDIFIIRLVDVRIILDHFFIANNHTFSDSLTRGFGIDQFRIELGRRSVSLQNFKPFQNMDDQHIAGIFKTHFSKKFIVNLGGDFSFLNQGFDNGIEGISIN